VATTQTVAKVFPYQHPFLISSVKYPCFTGGIGSGKSRTGCLKAVVKALSTPGGLGLIAAPTFPMLRDATQRAFFELLPEREIVRFNKTEQHLRLRNGAEVVFRSLDNADSRRGPNLAWIFVDEAALCSAEAWRILKGRLRQPGFPLQAWITTTPRGRNWVWDEWVDRPTPNYALFRARTAENRALPPGYIEGLGYSGQFALQELEGQFVAFEGLVYPQFDRVTHVHQPHEAAYATALGGIDFGFTNPAVVLPFGLTGDGVWRQLDEWYERRKVIDDIIAAAKDFQGRYGVVRWYCDPSEPAYIEQLQRAGVRAIAADNERLAGVAAVAKALALRPDGTAGLTIAPACVQTQSEYETYQYPEKKAGQAQRDEPIKAFDHAMDATRYVIFSQVAHKSGAAFLDDLRRRQGVVARGPARSASPPPGHPGRRVPLRPD
jgi:PBSX family phage terminase large subunit